MNLHSDRPEIDRLLRFRVGFFRLGLSCSSFWRAASCLATSPDKGIRPSKPSGGLSIFVSIQNKNLPSDFNGDFSAIAELSTLAWQFGPIPSCPLHCPGRLVERRRKHAARPAEPALH
jgi:hypothetical protein